MAARIEGSSTEMERVGIDPPAPLPPSRLELPYLRTVMVHHNPKDLTTEKCSLVFQVLEGTPRLNQAQISACQDLRTALEGFHIATLKNGLSTGFLDEAKVLAAALRTFRNTHQDIIISGLKTDHVPTEL